LTVRFYSLVLQILNTMMLHRALFIAAATWGVLTDAADHTVTIAGFAFSPSSLSIAAGDTVTWVNTDGATHTATDDGSAWDTGFLGGSVSSSPITFSTAGDFSYHCAIHTFMTASIQVTGCVSACGDPHFTGLDHVKYDFQGEPNKTFAMISDPSVEVNSAFTQSFRQTTVLGDTCVRVCGHSLVMTTLQEVFVDGKELVAGQSFNSTTLNVLREDRSYVLVDVPGRWHFRFNMISNRYGDHINVDIAQALYAYDGKTHGVLGHTLKGTPVPKAKCNKVTEGSCEVEGSFTDYEVAGDICSSEWRHSFFNPSTCA